VSAAIQSPATAKTLRVLVVEDEVLIRMLFEDMLAELGHRVDGEAGRIEDAMELAKLSQCDVAILDVKLNGADVYPVADLLAERGIPFLFATGQTGTEMPEKFRDRPTMQKPFQADRLQEMLLEITRG
jgi:CheY-like chemotaxis protein